MVVFDTAFLLHLIDPNLNPPTDPNSGQPVSKVSARIMHLANGLKESREKIIIPAPALAELLMLAEKACQRRSKIGPKGGVKLVHFL